MTDVARLVKGIGHWPAHPETECPQGTPMGDAYEKGWNAALDEVLGRAKRGDYHTPLEFQGGWTAKDCANYGTRSFPHPSCKAAGRPCAIQAEPMKSPGHAGAGGSPPGGVK